MSKNIVVFSDGTGERGGVRPDQVLTNVYKLYRAARISEDNLNDPARQVSYYSPGLGTISDDGVIKLSAIDKLTSVAGLAFGIGITKNIIDCYEFILENYKTGDRIYLFGFSRGAYTVRSVAGVLRLCGVPTHDKDGSVLSTSGPKLRRIAKYAVKKVYEYHYRRAQWGYESKRMARATRFRKDYGSEAAEPDYSKHVFSNVAPYFIGVFETVGALVLSLWKKIGLFFILMFASILCGLGFDIFSFLTTLSMRFHWPFPHILLYSSCAFFVLLGGYFYIYRWKSTKYDKSLDFRVKYARQALAIDEWRADFERVPWGRSEDLGAHEKQAKPGDPVWLKQVWFAGDHADIGGGYPVNESRLSDITLDWMLDELRATDHPLELNEGRLNVFPDPAGMQHDEVQASRERWPYIFFRLAWRKSLRVIEHDAELHKSVFARFDCGLVQNFRSWAPYRPGNLKDHDGVKKYYVS